MKHTARMDALIDLALRALLLLVSTAFGAGALCLLLALYGAGSDWPAPVSALLAALWAGLWTWSIVGAVRNR